MDNNSSYVSLIENFKQLSHQDQYDKLLVYLHAAQKSEENLIGLYLLIETLGPDNIESDILVELYDAFLSFVEYDDKEKLVQAQSTIAKLQSLREKEKTQRKIEEEEIESMLYGLD